MLVHHRAALSILSGFTYDSLEPSRGRGGGILLKVGYKGRFLQYEKGREIWKFLAENHEGLKPSSDQNPMTIYIYCFWLTVEL